MFRRDWSNWLVVLAATAWVLFVLPGCQPGDEKKPPPAGQPEGEPGPSTPEPAGGAAEGEPVPAAPSEPDFSVTDVQFAEEFDTDAEAAAKKYANKWVEIKGTLGSAAGKNIFGQDVLALKGVFEETDTGFKVRPVPCGLAPEAVSAARELTVTQEVTLLGKYEEGSVDANLAHCRIVSTGPDPAIEVTAEEMAAEYVADEDAAEEKYYQKQVLVEGVVAEIVENEFGNLNLQLEGSEREGKPFRIDCGFPADAKDDLKDVAKGQRVRVKGGCDGLLDDVIAVSSCVLLEAAPGP
jgi:hypothetical protein